MIRHYILAVLLVVGAAGTAVGVSPAATKETPCWKVLINDWYDGRIDGIYPIHCYRDALERLPADVDTYSSARDDIRQALQERIVQSRRERTKTTATTTTPGNGNNGGSNNGGNTNNGGSNPGGGNENGGSGPGTTPTPPKGSGQASGGPINNAIDATKPDKADSLPVPLLVLGGVALLLMVAGAAGFLARRSRLRRMQLASAASVPQGTGGDRPKQP